MAASEGVDLEWAIVDLSKIKQNKQTDVSRNYSAKIMQQAEKCSNHLITSLGSKFDIWHSDDATGPFGSIYAKPEPKTDIVAKKGGKIYTLSVKMEGGIQLASGQGASTAELFKAAASKTGSKSRVLSSIIKELETIPTRLLSESNMSRIMQEANPKVINEFIRKGKIIQDKSYEYWVQNNKAILMESLLKFVQTDKQFYFELVKEAMTGEETLKSFRGAVANSIISPAGFHVIDKSYIDKVIPKIKMDLRAKSRGGISSVAFRIETKGSV